MLWGSRQPVCAEEGDSGGIDGERDAICIKGDVARSFCSIHEGFRDWFGGNTWAEPFLRELRDVRQLLFAFAARHQDDIAANFGHHISQTIMASISQDFGDVTKGVGDVTAVEKTQHSVIIISDS